MNEQNFHYYLRWLVKIADDRPLRYEEIPQKFIDFFSLPGLSQAINICIDNKPEVDYDKVENLLIGKTFPGFNEVAAAIQNNFESDYEKLYACFYYVANTISYDIPRSLLEERDPLTIQTIFDTKLGVCAEYSKYFRELAKLCGIPSKKILILQFINASKGAGWDSYNPPNEPIYKHEANFIKIQNQFYISEPTWASGK